MNEVRKFRKKPVVIEAIQWDGTTSRLRIIQYWCPAIHTTIDIDGVLWLRVLTEEGMMSTRPNDWVIKGVKGEFYFCRCDIFNMTYEIVEEGDHE